METVEKDDCTRGKNKFKSYYVVWKHMGRGQVD